MSGEKSSIENFHKLTMKVLIEGPDLSGKSTLCNELKKDKELNDQEGITVFERDLLITKLILGTCDIEVAEYGLYSKIIELINNRIKDSNYDLVVFLLPPYWLIQDRLSARGDQFLEEQEITRIYQSYRILAQVLREYNDKVIILTTHHKYKEDLIEEVRRRK